MSLSVPFYSAQSWIETPDWGLKTVKWLRQLVACFIKAFDRESVTAKFL